MDIRFLAVIFLIAALIEMLAKMMRKARAAQVEDGSEPKKVVDPMARVFEEMNLLPGIEETIDPTAREAEPGAGERRHRAERAGPDMTGGAHEPASGGPQREPDDPWALPSATSPTAKIAEPVVAEPTAWPEPSVPAEPVPAPASEEIVPYRDRSPRPIEVRSREFRPREAREIVPRSRDEADPAPVVAGAVKERAPGEAGGRRGVEGMGGSAVPGLGSVRDLRRLVVAREVLGPPLARRGEERFTER